MSGKLTKYQIEEIRQRAGAATEGPWVCADTTDGAWILDQDDMIISGTCERDQDAAFIANARQDIPSLLDHITFLNEVISSCRCAECGDELGKIGQLTTE
ncbi:hypothetical protein LBW83_16570 [Bacillus velezensis]|uniref:hypothetical protein n=1 Tax=Bacillus velezensis TaxID=492670 RepID=UPI001CD5D2B8|nr:hypothetical protein [Bacillus velezensis]MCA1233227.1 hypothetical protein [Bacillus velezensis]MCA1311327.1 hypothetical protein [Bacillus velezensis]MCA1330436.1 hypothetical protein [Bacillus velezensis]